MKTRLKLLVFFFSLLVVWVSCARDVTFLATSDCHYDYPENEDRNDRNRATIRHINVVTNLMFPDEFGGGKIPRPRGVVVLGDLVDDGDRCTNSESITKIQWTYWEADFGLDGTDGLIDYIVYETWGNHDGPPEGAEKCGFSVQAQIKNRNKLRLQKHLISNLSENNLHYSWDWEDVHFVIAGIYPANVQNPLVKRYNPVWHNPQNGLDFVKSDLEKNVGSSGRPVVIMAHCGFDTDWWHTNDWKAFYDVIKPYNVVLYMYGHTGTGLKQWSPPGESKKIQCINTGQTENGFWVVRITNDRLIAAYRIKHWIIEKPDEPNTSGSKKGVAQKQKRKWDGTWEWKYLLDKSLKE